MNERLVTLRGGRFDGKQVEIDGNAVEFWAYQNMYNQPRAVKAGGFPRSESMATYRVLDAGDVAEFVENS
jgi:hypothetical protein